MISVLLTKQIPLCLQSYFNVTVVIIWCFASSYDVHLTDCVYTIVVCWVFIIMLRVLCFIKNRMYEIWYHFSRDHESSGFQKLPVNKSICQKKSHFFRWSAILLFSQFSKTLLNTKANRVVVCSCRPSPTFLNTWTINEICQQSGKQDSFRHLLKSPANM